MNKIRKLFIIILILLAFSFFALFPRLLKISEIECQSQFGPCDNLLIVEIQKYKNKSYYKAKTEINKYLENNGNVSSFTTRFMLPNKLKIDVIEKKPVVAITKDRQTFYLVDKSGFVQHQVNQNTLPTILLSSNSIYELENNKQLINELKFSVDLMQKIYYVYNTSDAEVGDNYMKFKLNNSKEVLMPLAGDQDILFGSLQIILSRLNQEDNYSIIDLRYKNPILK